MMLLRLLMVLLVLGVLPELAQADDFSGSHRIVLLGDPHLPGKFLEQKQAALRTINRWGDVNLVVALGDICQERGTLEEYRSARQFFDILRHPLITIPGNHDVGYDDVLSVQGKKIRASNEVRRSKLAVFRQYFGLSADYHSRRVGTYLLVFLATDAGSHLAGMSKAELAWLDRELSVNFSLPTIIFFHAPLDTTLASYNSAVNTPDFVAQPAATLSKLLARYPQVVLWVSGHTHTTPHEPSFSSEQNLYQGRVVNIHTTDLNRKHIWTRSLFLQPDRIVIRTWDHSVDRFLPELEKVLAVRSTP